jgi:hypothetical protein
MKIEEMIFEVRGPVIGDAQLAAAEEALGVPLPADYRGFLLLHNGGWSRLCVCEEPLVRMQLWLSVCDATARPICSLVKANQNMADDLHGCFIVIGETLWNADVLMKAGGPGSGRIGLWHPDQGTIDEIGLPFSSFQDFVHRLQHSEALF